MPVDKKTKIQSNKIFSNFLEYFFLVYISEIDKPTSFLVFPLFFAVANLFLKFFMTLYFSIICFLFYEYIAGNSLIIFLRDIIVYYLTYFAIFYIKLKIK